MNYDPFTDDDCIDAFIEENEKDFFEWLAENIVDTNNSELLYCESRERAFLEFAYNYLEDIVMDEADFDNDLNEDFE